MAQNEETIYIPNAAQPTGNKSQVKNQPKNEEKAWRKVAMGGAAGILLGAGAMYAADAMAANPEPETEAPDTKPEGENPSQDAAAANDNATFKVAESHDDQSFKEAFNAARAEVGPGGAFHWHGNIYSTYTEDEWNNMTDAEKNDYAQAVKPEIRPQVTHDANLHQTSDVEVAGNQDADVHLVNAGEVQLADGSTATVGVYEMNGHEVSVVDFDQDGTPDVAICDVNQNGVIEEGEAIDLHTGQVISLDSNNYADNTVDASTDPNLQTASLENPDVAPDMPDYMSDADLPMA